MQCQNVWKHYTSTWADRANSPYRRTRELSNEPIRAGIYHISQSEFGISTTIATETSSQPCLQTGYDEDKYTEVVSMNFESEQRTMWINRRNLLHIH